MTISDSKLLKRCSRCVMPETQEVIAFDSEGVCSTCRNLDMKHEQIDWTLREEEFRRIIDYYRGKSAYDCIVPFSGGKDSTFILYTLVKTYGLKPLVVSFDHHLYRPVLLANRERTLKRLGVDYLGFRSDWQLIKKLMRVSLERKGDILWYQHTGIYSLPARIALKWQVPLIIWGEPSSEYVSYFRYDEIEEEDETHFNMFRNLGITAEDMLGMLGDTAVTMRELAPYVYPKRDDLRALKCRSIFLGSYIPWDVKKQVETITRELGWQGDTVEGVPPEYHYEKIEDMMQGVQDYLKFIKRGYGRMSHLASIDIRNGRMTRDNAMKMIGEWEGQRPASLDVFLNWMNMTEEEFYHTVSVMGVAPWKHDPTKTKRGKELPDQKLWNKD